MGKKTRKQFTLLDRKGRQAMEKFQRRCLEIMPAPAVIVLFDFLKRRIKAGALAESFYSLTGTPELDAALTKMVSDRRAWELFVALLEAIERGRDRMQRLAQAE